MSRKGPSDSIQQLRTISGNRKDLMDGEDVTVVNGLPQVYVLSPVPLNL